MNESRFGIRLSGFGKRVAQTFRSAAFPPAVALQRGAFSKALGTALAFLALCLAPACRPKPSSQPPALLPETNEVPGWSKTDQTRTFEAERLWEYIDGDAEKYLQAGVAKTLTADYRYQDKFEAVADLHIMKTPEGARKILDSEATAESQRLELGDAAQLTRGSVKFRKGPYFVRLVAYQEAPEADKALTELARAIENKLATAGARN